MLRRRIAWSRSGLLAFINRDHEVRVTWLACENGENWDYASPVRVPLAPEVSPACLSWSPTNFDLLVTDTAGKIHIIGLLSVREPSVLVSGQTVTDSSKRLEEVDAVVGVHWLSLDKKILVPNRSVDASTASSLTASKSWEQLPAKGPFHPMKTRNVLLAVNINGMLRVLVQQQGHEYTEKDLKIPCSDCSANVIACEFVQYSNTSLIMLLVTTDNILRAYEVRIKWIQDNNKNSSSGSSVDPSNTKEKKSTYQCNVQVFPICGAELPSIDLANIIAFCKEQPKESDATQNSRPEIEIKLTCKRGKVMNLVLKSSIENLDASFLELFTITQPVLPEPHVVWTLDIRRERSAIKLEQQGVKKENAAIETESQIANDLDQAFDNSAADPDNDVRFYFKSKFVLITVYNSGRVGTEPLYPGSNILQFDKAGLEFNPQEIKDSKYLMFSPFGFCAATLDKTGSLKILRSKLSAPLKNQISDEQISLLGRTFSSAYSCTVLNSEQCDDVLCTAWKELYSDTIVKGRKCKQLFQIMSSESQRMLNVNLSAPEDQQNVDRLVVIPSPPQRWLSFLVVLGTKADWKRGPGCKVALTILHLQSCAFGLTWTLKKISQRQKTEATEQLRSEVLSHQFYISSMLGPIKWFTDLVIRLCQEIFDLNESNTDGEMGSTDTQQSAKFAQPNIYLSLLMSGISRYLLRYILRGIRTLTASAKSIAEAEARLNNSLVATAKQKYSETDSAQLEAQLRGKLVLSNGFAAAQILRQLVSQLQSAPFPFDAFEKLLVEIDEGVKTLLNRSQKLDTLTKRTMQADIIRYAVVPGFYQPLIGPILAAAQRHMFSTMDLPRFYFYDTSWLELDDKRYVVDGLQKKMLLTSQEVKCCSRCGMLTLEKHQKPIMHWLYIFHRYCICGGTWMKLNPKK